MTESSPSEAALSSAKRNIILISAVKEAITLLEIAAPTAANDWNGQPVMEAYRVLKDALKRT